MTIELNEQQRTFLLDRLSKYDKLSKTWRIVKNQIISKLRDEEEPINEKMDRQGDNGDETKEDKREADNYIENL